MNNCVLKRDNNEIVEHIQGNIIDIISTKTLYNRFIKIGPRNITLDFLINLCNI